MALSIERQQAILRDGINCIGRKDPRELLPTPSDWSRNVFEDEELKHHLISAAYDVLESTWSTGVQDEKFRQALHERRMQYQSEHHLPDGKTIDELTSAEQKFYHWKFDQVISTAAFQSEAFQQTIEGLQSGALTREDIIPPSISSEEVVLVDFAAGED